MSQQQQERLEQQINAEEEQVEAVETESVTPVGIEPTLQPASASPTLPSTPVTEETTLTDAQETPSSAEGQPTGETLPKKRRKRKGRWVSAEEISPKPSFWPLALTLSICVLLMGIMVHPIVIGVGAILVIGSIMGWILERR